MERGLGSVVGHPEKVSDCAWHSREMKGGIRKGKIIKGEIGKNEERKKEREKVQVTLRRCCRMAGWAIHVHGRGATASVGLKSTTRVVGPSITLPNCLESQEQNWKRSVVGPDVGNL